MSMTPMERYLHFLKEPRFVASATPPDSNDALERLDAILQAVQAAARHSANRKNHV